MEGYGEREDTLMRLVAPLMSVASCVKIAIGFEAC
jgi:hypothetical protein